MAHDSFNKQYLAFALIRGEQNVVAMRSKDPNMMAS